MFAALQDARIASMRSIAKTDFVNARTAIVATPRPTSSARIQ